MKRIVAVLFKVIIKVFILCYPVWNSGGISFIIFKGKYCSIPDIFYINWRVNLSNELKSKLFKWSVYLFIYLHILLNNRQFPVERNHEQ